MLGESILAATVRDPVRDRRGRRTLGARRSSSAGALLIVFSMWWIYFDRPIARPADRACRVAASVGLRPLLRLRLRGRAGAGLAVGGRRRHAPRGDRLRGGDLGGGDPGGDLHPGAVDGPLASRYRGTRLWDPLAAGLILLTPLLDLGVLPIGLIFVALLLLKPALH